MTKKIKVVQMGTDTLENVVRNVFTENEERIITNVNTAVENTMAASFSKQSEIEKKQQQIDKILRRDSVAKEANKKVEHDNSCPNCHSEIEKLGDGIGICKDCGTTTLEKGAKVGLLCDTCGGIVPESFVGTDKNCPHCGGVGVHKI